MLGVGEAPQATDTEEEGRRPPPPKYSVLRLGGEREERREREKVLHRCGKGGCASGPRARLPCGVVWSDSIQSYGAADAKAERSIFYCMCEARFAFWARNMARKLVR